MSQLQLGSCEHCQRHFNYAIYHCGFGDSAYGYCSQCGHLSILDGWSPLIPNGVNLGVHHPFSLEVAALVTPCSCGGMFRGDASPRCPHCHSELDAVAAASYIEANANGTDMGWRWQRCWDGIYCIDVDGAAVRDNWCRPNATV
jgi:hypothetical protein